MGVNARRTVFCSTGTSLLSVVVGKFKQEHPVPHTDIGLYIAETFFIQP